MNDIRAGQLWQHTDSGRVYLIVQVGKVKIPTEDAWHAGISYTPWPTQGEFYTRTLEDFETKFKLHC